MESGIWETARNTITCEIVFAQGAGFVSKDIGSHERSVIHDLMSEARYGDIKRFVNGLKQAGYEKVEMINTTNGMFMSPFEAKWMMLTGSTLLIGRK